METIANFEHKVASHCESGTVRNLLKFSGLDVTEPMIFGIGSGPAFFYLFFVKGPSGFPLCGIRNPPGGILKNVRKRCKIDFFEKKYRSTDAAFQKVDALIDKGIPVAVSVDMFYMKYLPAFMHVHAPFHFICLVGRNGDTYAVSDPYFEPVGELGKDHLRTAWATHAPMARDNFLSYVLEIPKSINWEKAIVKSIKKTCNGMILPPGVNKAFAFMGIQGMRMYARQVLLWPKKYRGSMLREGILFNAVGFEDQGTGGGAFRLMYGAFLQETAKVFGSNALSQLAEQMIDHGKAWRDISRLIIKVGKIVPMDDNEFDGWFSKNENDLNVKLAEISSRFLERAAFEERFFVDLKKVAKDLKFSESE